MVRRFVLPIALLAVALSGRAASRAGGRAGEFVFVWSNGKQKGKGKLTSDNREK
jgi:hypothetical protein